jgi:hypothetical protein
MGRASWMFVAVACAGILAGCSRGRAAGDSPAKASDAAALVPADGLGSPPCTPSKLEGPEPCMTDGDCVKRSGEGWFCTPEPLTIDDGCGGKLAWGRVCACCEGADGR